MTVAFPAESPPHGPPGTRLVIGIGNEHRGDDAVGPLVARRLRPILMDVARVVEADVGGAELIDLWTGTSFVWVVDAARAGGPPGTMYRFEVGKEELPASLGSTSTHGVSLADAVALGGVLGRLPTHLVIYGVEPGHLEMGTELSHPVKAAVEPLVRRIEGEVRSVQGAVWTEASVGGPDA